MQREEIVMICTSDLAGQVRGKGFPAAELFDRLERGVGWTPTNSQITALGTIAPSPWGPFGDLCLRPDPDAHFRFDLDDGHAAENFVLGDILNLDGTPWEVCPRGFLKRALAALEERHGLKMRVAFEHEFVHEGVEERLNASYALDAFRRQDLFAGTFLGALRAVGIEPDTFSPEYGPTQYEITVAPAEGLRAADQAVAVREIARAVAFRLGHRVSFTPILRPDSVGNGVHVHFSLVEADSGRPVDHDPDRPYGISGRAGAFLAGIARKMPAIVAVTAAAPISYLRLVPHRWSAAYNNVGLNDREAGVRICPVFPGAGVPIAEQFHFEYRAADAAASPYLLLGILVAAGLFGLDGDLPLPAVTDSDPAVMEPAERARLGVERLPLTLREALDVFAAEPDLTDLVGRELKTAYVAHKGFEATAMADVPIDDQCIHYRLLY